MADMSKGRGKIVAFVIAAVAVIATLVGVYEGKKVVAEEDRISSDTISQGQNQSSSNAPPVSIKTDAGGKVTLGPYTRIQLLISEVETKDHFTMPAGMKKVEVTITWTGSGWDLELLIGTGECADSGEVMASGKGNAGNITVSYEAEGNDTLQEGQWFIIVRCSNMNEHIRESLTINENVLVYPAA
ncbi:MAG: hypothetical protein QW728_00630 [Thermoplasmata archaeon]